MMAYTNGQPQEVCIMKTYAYICKYKYTPKPQKGVCYTYVNLKWRISKKVIYSDLLQSCQKTVGTTHEDGLLNTNTNTIR